MEKVMGIGELQTFSLVSPRTEFAAMWKYMEAKRWNEYLMAARRLFPPLLRKPPQTEIKISFWCHFMKLTRCIIRGPLFSKGRGSKTMIQLPEVEKAQIRGKILSIEGRIPKLFAAV